MVRRVIVLEGNAVGKIGVWVFGEGGDEIPALHIILRLPMKGRGLEWARMLCNCGKTYATLGLAAFFAA